MPESERDVGLLLSGGLDSSILLGHLLGEGRSVRPFYVRSHLAWEHAELQATQRFLHALTRPALRPLVVLDLPIDDVYGDHWSTTGRDVPGLTSPDSAVYLPGRNVLLTVKAALWCQLHGIEELALATLSGNPFADATAGFFDRFQDVLGLAVGRPIRLVRPFSAFDKREVMVLGQGLPLAHTFSCIAPVGKLHCGRCNKFAERHGAFHLAEIQDPTCYAQPGWSAAAPPSSLDGHC
jgi:7-cyano-7-deazaguanine synthase